MSEPTTLQDLVGHDLAGYQPTHLYWLCSSGRPAIVTATKQHIICQDTAILEWVSEQLPGRADPIMHMCALIHPEKKKAFCISGLQGVNQYKDRHIFSVFSWEDINQLTAQSRDNLPFSWALY